MTKLTELRWLVKSDGTMQLQYRSRLHHIGKDWAADPITEWSDWEDVPMIDARDSAEPLEKTLTNRKPILYSDDEIASLLAVINNYWDEEPAVIPPLLDRNDKANRALVSAVIKLENELKERRKKLVKSDT